MECTEPPVECTKKVAEYFLICGLPEKPMSYDLSKVLTHAEEIIIPENTVDFTIFPQPIVDIQLICLKSQGSLPSGYVPIRHSVSGKYKADISRVGDEVYICFRRGRDKPPITNIAMFTDNECHDLRPDAEIIPKTSDGKSANFRNPLTHPTYLSFTRASITSGIDQLAVIDMCIIFPGKHETCPPAFHQLPEALYTNMLGNQAFLCFRKSLIKEHTIAYEPEVLFCYRVPSTIVELESKLNTSGASDELQTGGPPSPQAPLDPEVCQVAHFCLPWGASIESWSVDQEPPQPNHFSFVLTNESCQRLYGVAFTFHEPYDPSKLDLQMCYLLGVEPDFLFPRSQAVQSESKLNPEEEAKITSRQKHFIRSRIGDRVVGVTKTMCILSRWSFPVAFTNFLAFLYSRCLPGVGNGSIPLERYLAYFLCEIPFPDQNTPNVLVELCAAPILLCLPDEANASSSCEPFFYLLKQLGVDLTINLFVHMLTEQKILLTSVQHFLLTQVGEALTSMIFPLQWTVVYIPFIYMGHVQVIESPSPYLIGVDSRFFDFFRLPTSGSSDGPSVTYVDLDTHNFKPANVSDQPALDAKSLPKKPMKRLRSLLQALYRQIQALCQKQPKWNANFLLKCLVTEPDSSLADTELKWLRTRTDIGKRVKQAFLQCMTSLLKDYRHYLIPVRNAQRDRLFNSEAFLDEVTDAKSRLFYQALFETQQWANFVRDRTYASSRDEKLDYFDSLIARRYGDLPTYSEMPAVNSLTISSGGSHHSSNDVNSSESAAMSVTGSYSSQDILDESTVLMQLSQSQLSNASTRIFGVPTWPLSDWPFHSNDGTPNQELVPKLPAHSYDLVPVRWNSELLDQLSAYGYYVQMLAAQDATAGLESTAYAYSSFGCTLQANVLPLSSCSRPQHPNALRCLPEHPLSTPSGISSPFVPRVGGLGNLGLTGLVTKFPLPFGSNLIYRRSLLELQETAEFHRRAFKDFDLIWCKRLIGSLYALWFMLFPAYLGHLYMQVLSLSEHDNTVTEAPPNSEVAINEANATVNSRLSEAFQLAQRLSKCNLGCCDQVVWRILLVLVYQNRPPDVSLTEFINDPHWNATSTTLVNRIYKAYDQELREQRRLEQELASRLMNHRDNNLPTHSVPSSYSRKDPGDVDGSSNSLNAGGDSDFAATLDSETGRSGTDSGVVLSGIGGIEDEVSASAAAAATTAAALASCSVHTSSNSLDDLKPYIGRAPIASVDDLTDLGYPAPEHYSLAAETNSLVGSAVASECCNHHSSSSPPSTAAPAVRAPKVIRPSIEQLEHVQRAPQTSWFEQATSQLHPTRERAGLRSESNSVHSNALNTHSGATCSSNSTDSGSSVDCTSQENLTSPAHLQNPRASCARSPPIPSNHLRSHTESLDGSEQSLHTTDFGKSRGSLDYLNERLVSFTKSELTTKLVQSFKDLLTPKRHPSTAENSPYIPRRSTTAGLPPVTASPCSARLPRNMRRWRLPTVGSPGPPINSEPQSSTDNTGHNGEFNPGIRSANSSVNSHEQLTNQLQHLRDHWFYVAGGLVVGNLHQRLLTATLSAQLHGRIPQKCTGFPHSPDSGQLPPPAACAVSRSPSVQWLNDHERTPSEEPHTLSSNPRTTNVSQLIVSLTTCNTCPHCRKFVHDEEIMAAWTADEEQYDIRCPFCSCAFVPQLTVRVLGELRRSDLSPSPPCSPRSPPSRGGSTPPSRSTSPRSAAGISKGLMEFTHFYLSPFALRKSLETVLQREGDECFRYNPMKHSFLCRYERLAWNLIWYIHRLGLPTHLLDGFASWLMERQLERQRNATADTMRGEIPGKVLDGLLHVQLSPDLPVRVSLRWNAYHNNRGTVNKPLYKLWSRHMAEYRNRGIRPSDLFVDNRRSALKERILAISSCPVYLVMAYIVSDIVSNKVFSALDLLVRLRTSVFTKMPVSTVIQLREQQQHAADEVPSGDTPDTASNSSHSCSDVSPLPLENSIHSPCTESRCCVCALEDSLYRELLFLILTALTAQGINVAHFDEEYRDAYMRHLSNQCPSLFDSDRAPNHVAAACRQMLRPLSLIP